MFSSPAWAQQSALARPAGPPTGAGKAAVGAPAESGREGRNVLNAGPEPRVLLPADSRDRAAIFGTADPDELALAAQENAIDEQRLRLQVLESLFGQAPEARSAPSGRIPLRPTSADLPPPSMPRLTPAPAGARIDGTRDARGQIDGMQRRVDGLLRNADALRQPAH
ncbi:hypothetical protein ACXIUT_25510 [Achromobacter denitrificans]